MIQLSVTLPERDIQTHRDGAAAEYLHSIVVTPPLVCNMVFHQCNAVWHSVEYLFGKWHFLIETPFIVHRHIAGHATRVSHPKNMRSEVIQNGFKFKVCSLIFSNILPCKRFRKYDSQNVEF